MLIEIQSDPIDIQSDESSVIWGQKRSIGADLGP